MANNTTGLTRIIKAAGYSWKGVRAAWLNEAATDFHELSGRAKDMGSAAVLMSILLALATWGMLLWPHYR